MKVSIFHDPRKHKAWVVRWFGVPDLTSGKKKRYSKGFKTEDEALKFRAAQELAFLEGRPRDRAEEPALKQFCADWLRAHRRSLRPATYRDYRNLAERLVGFFGKDCLLRQIGARGANEFIAELEPKSGKNLSDATRNKVLRYCRAMFSDAVTWELLSQNPFRKVKKRKLAKRPWHYMDAEQYKKLLAAVPNLRWQALYALTYTCGLRLAEAYNLRWPDIDFERGTLTVRNYAGTDTLPPFETKSGKSRMVPVPKDTREILLRAQLQQGRQRLPYVLLSKQRLANVTARWKDCQERRRPWESGDMVNNVQRNFNRHIRKAGIKPDGTFTLHTLRKCAGKNWADRIANPRVVQELMGHAALSTTMEFYNKVVKDDMQKAASAIDALLAGSDAKTDAEAASA